MLRLVTRRLGALPRVVCRQAGDMLSDEVSQASPQGVEALQILAS